MNRAQRGGGQGTKWECEFELCRNLGPKERLFAALGPTWELLLPTQVMVLRQVVSSVFPSLWQSCFFLASGFYLCKRRCGFQLFSAPKKAETTASPSSTMLLVGCDTVHNASAGATGRMNAGTSLQNTGKRRGECHHVNVQLIKNGSVAYKPTLALGHEGEQNGQMCERAQQPLALVQAAELQWQHDQQDFLRDHK